MTENRDDSLESSAEIARLARLVRQRLEINRLFGWDVPLRRSRLMPPPSSPPPSPRATTSPLAGASSPTDPQALLLPLAAEVAECTRCDLCHSRTHTVFGVGNPAARLLFVGEGPGADEDRQGEPFVGAAGQLLDRIIGAMGLRREDVYIANVVKCRPPENRTPSPGEVGFCLPYLEEQIRIIRPEVIVALGTTAARTLLQTGAPMSALRSRFHDYRGILLMPTYHPAYLLRYPAEKRKVWEDIQVVMRKLGLSG